MQTLEVDKVFALGQISENDLTENETLIYAVVKLELDADMQGWDHFFTSSMRLYPWLCRLLILSSDFSSLSIIKDYENHFKLMGGAFEVDEIDRFLTHVSDEYLSACPDWREQFNDLSDQRWKLVIQYFQNIGIQLVI